MEDLENKKMICGQCSLSLELGKVGFTYQGQQLYTDILKCPNCAMVFIAESMAKGKMLQVEMTLEDK